LRKGNKQMKGAPLDGVRDPMQIQKASRQDYVPMMEEEDMDAFEGFGEEVPIYDVNEEDFTYYEGEQDDKVAMDGFEDEAPFFEYDPYNEEFGGDNDMIMMPDYNETLDQDIYYTQEDIDMMAEGYLDMEEDEYYDDTRSNYYVSYDEEEDRYYDDAMMKEKGEEEYDGMMEDMDYETILEEDEQYQYMLREEELFAEMGLEKEAEYEAAMIEEEYGIAGGDDEDDKM